MREINFVKKTQNICNDLAQEGGNFAISKMDFSMEQYVKL
jgi:hypothetical protein